MSWMELRIMRVVLLYSRYFHVLPQQTVTQCTETYKQQPYAETHPQLSAFPGEGLREVQQRHQVSAVTPWSER